MTRKLRPYKDWEINAVVGEESRRRGFFADPGRFIKDHTWIEHAGRWHVFYITGNQAGCFVKQRDVCVGHASTADFVTWRTHASTPMDGAPTVIAKDGTFYLYANRKVGDKGKQGICLATSRDLEEWTVHDKYPVYVPDAKLYGWPEVPHCRDYHVMPFEGGYLMLFCETTRDMMGCVGAIRSSNLVDWEDLGPIFVVDKDGWGFTQWSIVGYGIPESPFLMEKDGRWHLLITENMVTRTYRLWSDKPLEGWSWDRSAYFHGAPTGWDWAGKPDFTPAAAAASTAAYEIFETRFGWVVSYYFFDPVEMKTVLRVEPLAWHDGHPFIQARWPGPAIPG
jgi:hypothetical protein